MQPSTDSLARTIHLRGEDRVLGGVDTNTRKCTTHYFSYHTFFILDSVGLLFFDPPL